MLWAVSCSAKPDVDELRERVRAPHVEYLKAKLQEGVLVLSGPQLNEEGKIVGSMFMVNVDTAAEAKAFSDAEPFTKAGLYKSVTITRIRKGQWNPAGMERALNS